jgi:replicative DNA helicase
VSGHERNRQLLESLHASLDAKREAIDWPWPQFNSEFTRIVPGQFVLIGARPSNGKTTLVMGLLTHFDRLNVRTLVFGTEMVPENLVKRWAAGELRIPERDVFEDYLDDHQRDAIKRVAGDLLASGNVNFVDATSLSLDRIYEEMLAAAREDRLPAVVIIDHIHRMSQDWGELNKIAKEMAELAVQANIAVIACAQLNRGEKALDQYLPPQQDRLKGAAALEENADLALGLFRPLLPMARGTLQKLVRGEEQFEDHIERNTMGVICMKSRYHGTALGKVVRLRVTGSRLEPFGIRPREDVL